MRYVSASFFYIRRLRMGENQEPWYIRFEKWVEGVLQGAISLGMLFSAPILLIGSGLAKAASFVAVLLRAVADAFAKATMFALRLLGINPDLEDPFYLRRNGDTLLSLSVKIDLLVYTMLLALSMAFEAFAWGSMWAHVGNPGVGGVWGVIIGLLLVVLPLVFARLVILLDRGILVMDVTGGPWKRVFVVVGRASMLVLLSLITAVPVELLVFSQEIDREHAAAEKVGIDAIRAEAVKYETDHAESQKESAGALVIDQPDDVVARRKEERAAIVDQQKADRADIVARLKEKGDDAVREIAGRGVSRRRGSGYTANALRNQEKETRQELKDFDEAARKQLAEFDAETERMRSEAAANGVNEIARRDAELAETLHAIEVMPASELAAAYGGEYRVANGFMARYRTLLTLVEADGKNRAIAWGCRLVMVVVGLTVLFVKFIMASAETNAYFSMRSQALANNPDAVRHYIRIAKDAVQPEAEREAAVAVLKAVSSINEEAASALVAIGYDDMRRAGWSPEVVRLHRSLDAARVAARRARTEFEERFRQVCAERERQTGGFMAGVSRSEIVRRGQSLWMQTLEGPLGALSSVEGEMSAKGIGLPDWPANLSGGDPRLGAKPWELEEDKLESLWGWKRPGVGKSPMPEA
jgi:hypothetical protein